MFMLLGWEQLLNFCTHPQAVPQKHHWQRRCQHQKSEDTKSAILFKICENDLFLILQQKPLIPKISVSFFFLLLYYFTFISNTENFSFI